MRPSLLAMLYALLAITSVVALYDTGTRYNDFEIAQAGVNSLVEGEIAFYFWYALWGSCAAMFFVLALMQTSLPERAACVLDACASRPRALVACAALLVAAAALAFRAYVLLDQAIADDEATYLFEAQTLLAGRLVNPSPPYPGLLRNQFIVLGARGWYGQYPIGHPLLLAVGELLHARWLVVPVLGAISVWLTYAVGKRLFEPKRAVLAACALALSPQFVWTHATQLSQPGSLTCMLLGIWALLRLEEAAQQLRWAVLAGVAWGFMLLIRPMPGALLLAAAAASHVAAQWTAPALRSGLWRRLGLQLLAASPGVLAGVAAIAATNYVESGSPWVSAYQTLHEGPAQNSTGYLSSAFEGALVHVPRGTGYLSNALGGALVRQNFWLFGWTLSFAFVPWMRPRRAAWLMWSLIAAAYAYRLIIPKTVVGTTGPIYVFEAVPLLVLASVDGAGAVARWLARIGVARARSWIIAVALASTLVALSTFVPIEMRAAYQGAAARTRVFHLLEHTGAERALIFANHLVLPERSLTWAYFPPNPSPSLDDRFLFVRQPTGVGGPRSAYEFWSRQFPDRRAFLYADTRQGQMFSELKPGEPPPPSATLRDLVSAREK